MISKSASHVIVWNVRPKVYSPNFVIEAYFIWGIYRHPNGNVPHFITDLEMVLNQIDNDETTVLIGDMSIDIIKFSNEDVVSCVATLMSYGYLPYITIPFRTTNFSMTCIGHIFVRLSRSEKILDIINGSFYCHHLPNFISIKYKRTCCKDERPVSRLFGQKNTTSYVQRMEAENWNDIYTGDGDSHKNVLL